MGATEIIGREPDSGRVVRITVEGEVIAAIEACDELCEVWVSAGLVDLQVNGYAGLDCNGNDLRPETITKLAQAMLRTGVTTFAPTVITAPEAEILERLEAIAEGRSRDAVATRCIPFVHVEGPHISPIDGYRGAHRRECVRAPSLAEFDRWQDACGGLVGLVTLSPHFAESAEYIAGLAERGVRVALGHTHATQEEILRAVDAGARLSTHLGNGIAPVLERHPNPIWSQLAEDRLSASFIADGHHLPAETLTAMVRAKGLERSMLVSDAVALAGMPPGRYDTPIGGRVELRADGRLSMEQSSTLAGAAMPLIECVGRAVRMTGRPLGEILVMATENPGRFVGDRGLLCVGARADVVRIRWADRATVQSVWLAGEHVYSGSVML